MRYFEDFHVGEVSEVGPVTVSEAEIVEFAQQFDPQPFHVDAEAAKATPFGGLIASGWHTTALFMGMFVRGVLLDSASLGSPGVEEIRWTTPVRPGDTLTGRSTVTDLRASSKDPRRGTVLTTNEVYNQDGVLVMTFTARGFFARRREAMEPNYGIATGSYEDERDDWRSAVDRARSEGWRSLELTAIVESLLVTLSQFLELHSSLLGAFERVSLHAPVPAESPDRMVAQIACLPLDGDVIFHPDTWGTEPTLGRLAERAVFENMDVVKKFGRSVDDLQLVFTQHPSAGFCLDVAHVWTCDPTLVLGHDLIDAFGDRLRQLHVSGIEHDGTHRPTTQADLDLYRPLLDRCRNVPWILEAVVARGG